MLRKKIFLPLFSLFVLGLVVWQVDPPKTISEATFFQLVIFFLPLFVFFASLFNIFINHFLKSITLGGGLTLPFILQAFSFLNIFTAGAVVLVITLIFIFYPKPKNTFYQTKIPKLSHLSKQR